MTFTLSIPQGEYFEWEDIITDNFAYAQQVPYLSDHQFTEKHTTKFKGFDFEDLSPLENHYFHWGEPQEPKQNKIITATPEPLSPKSSESTCNDEFSSPKKSIAFTAEAIRASGILTRDDLDILQQPSQNVDYLAFPWHECEADLWASRKYLKLIKSKTDNDQLSERLENASWRALVMGRLQLEKVNPRSFNWSKDQDDTWLHGPFVVSGFPLTASKSSVAVQPLSRPEAKFTLIENTDEHPVRSILKYSSLSGLLLRGSVVSSPIPRLRPTKDIRTQSFRKQRKTLRFSSEVKQYISLPAENKQIMNSIMSHNELHTPDASYVLDQASSMTPQTEACKFAPKNIHDLRSQTSSSRTSGIRKSSKRSISPSVCQVPSTRLRTDQAFGDVAALRSALRGVVSTYSSWTENHWDSSETDDLSKDLNGNPMRYDVHNLSIPPTNYLHPYTLAKIDKMDWTSSKEDQNPNSQPCMTSGLGMPVEVDGGFWRNFKGSNIVIDSSNTILSGLQSPPELTESRSGSVSEDEIDDEMEEYNLILG